jgi:spermidine synthase
VFGDAFGGLAVPWHLTTAEFLDEVTRVLRPGGAYVMNVIDGPRLEFVRAMAATGASRFPHVAVISGRGTIEGHGGGNLVVVASETPLDQASIEASIERWGELAQTAVVADPAAVREFVGDSIVLTDDFAPVDQLLGR